jgi:hypothetical protein
VKLAASPEHVRRLLARLSALEARTFLRRAARGGARVVVTVSLKPGAAGAGTGARLELRYSTDGSCTGQVEGAPPFMLGDEDCALLRQRCAGRDLLSIEERALRRITVTVGRRRLTLEKRGAVWSGLPTQRVASLLEKLRALRAVRVRAYGRVAPGAPYIELELEQRGAAPQACTFSREGRAVVKGRRVLYEVAPAALQELERILTSR